MFRIIRRLIKRIKGIVRRIEKKIYKIYICTVGINRSIEQFNSNVDSFSGSESDRVILLFGTFTTKRKNSFMEMMDYAIQEIGNAKLVILEEGASGFNFKMESDYDFIRLPDFYRGSKWLKSTDKGVSGDKESWFGEIIDRLQAKGLDHDNAEKVLWSYYCAFNRIMDNLKPDTVLIWNKGATIHSIMDHICKDRDILCKNAEFGVLPNTYVIEDGFVGESFPAVEYDRFLQLPVVKKELDEADRVWEYLYTSGANRNVQKKDKKTDEALSKIKAGRPVLLVAGSNDVDSGLYPQSEHTKQYHSPMFESSMDALLYLAPLAEKNDWNLIYKPHPLVVKKSKNVKMPANVIYLTKGNINELIDFADVVISLVSQTAYISCIRRKATLMLGYNQLRGKGCTYEAFSLDEIEPQIFDAIKDGFTKKQEKCFRTHIAQLCKYYVYDTMPNNTPVVFGRDKYVLAKTLKEKLSDAEENEEWEIKNFDYTKYQICYEDLDIGDVQVSRIEEFNGLCYDLQNWIQWRSIRYYRKWGELYEEIVHGESPVEDAFIDIFSENNVFHFKRSEIEYKDKKAFWTTVKEVIINEEYYFSSRSKNPYIIDAGANIGIALMYFKSLFPDAEIIAFEPSKDIYDILQRNIERNSWENIKALPYCLGDEEKTVELIIPDNNTLGASITERGLSFGGDVKKEYVECKLLNNYVEREVDFLKMDIEGAEGRVFRSLGELINNIRNMFFEYHFLKDDNENSFAEMISTIENHNFYYEISKSLTFEANSEYRTIKHVGRKCSYNVWAKKKG